MQSNKTITISFPAKFNGWMRKINDVRPDLASPYKLKIG
jgi:hypothetical protein